MIPDLSEADEKMNSMTDYTFKNLKNVIQILE